MSERYTDEENGMYKFALLDPRPIPAAATANDAVFAEAPQGVLGIEVTVPTLASRCQLGNIDPQHSGGNAGVAAVEAALTAELPPEGAVLATVRADLDALGAMVVLAARQQDAVTGVCRCGTGEGVQCSYCFLLSADALARVRLVAVADKFARGGWPGAKALPTMENPWPEGADPLAAIGAAVMDHKVLIADRVSAVWRWLFTGVEPEGYRAQVERERAEMIRALETGEISVSSVGNGTIAVVRSAHRAAMVVGYATAPVVVAENPSFRLGGGEPHRKLTVAQFAPGHADIKSALLELAKLEEGWGGSPTIGGSPQGVSSKLATEDVVSVVERYLR